MSISNKLKSRKFLLALAGAILSVVGKTLKIPDDMIAWAIKILAVYICGESLADLALV